MKTKSFVPTAGAMAIAFATWLAPGLVQAQPMEDRIEVNLPYSVTVGDKTLPPGDYTIKRLPSNGSSRVLVFYSDSGMKFETLALPFAALDINTARETKLELNHVGDDYYVHKIWIQGKDYGYELPVPRGLKARQNEQMAKVNLPAQSVQTDTNANANATGEDLTATNRAIETTPEKEIEKTETETAQNIQQPVTEPNPNTADNTAVTADNNAVTADNTADRADNSADRSAEDQTPANTSAPTEMPKTAAGWLTMLLSGGVLSGAGLMLRRKQ